MVWEDSFTKQLPWSGEIKNRPEKEAIAKQIAAKIRDGQTIGAGSGSTVYLALFAIAERMRRENLCIRVIPSSAEISVTCLQLGIPQTTLLEARPDWSFDGADEADAEANLLKGRGGALFREKLLISSSPLTYILINESKLVKQLGEHFPVPVEIFPGGLTLAERRLRSLGATAMSLRPAGGKDGPLYTENGNWILDVHFDSLRAELETEIKKIPGVIESGLFYGYSVHLLVAKI